MLKKIFKNHVFMHNIFQDEVYAKFFSPVLLKLCIFKYFVFNINVVGVNGGWGIKFMF